MAKKFYIMAGRHSMSAKAALTLGAIALLLISVGSAVLLIRTRPEAKPRLRGRSAPIVETMDLSATNARVIVDAMGEVTPVNEITLQAQVSGRIVWVAPELVEGGTVSSNRVLVRIDSREYRFALQQKTASLQTALSNFRIEEGRQDIARKEWEIVNGTGKATEFDRELALREPQFRAAQAAVSSANAARELAALDLERTEIRSPCDAVVAKAYADVGDQASPGTTLARLVATGAYWVKASVRVEELPWLAFAGVAGKAGSKVVIQMPSGAKREGSLEAVAPELEETSRMARVLVRVQDPLLLDSSGKGEKLLLDEFLKMKIHGRLIEDVITIPRASLREGKILWLMDSESRLRMVPAPILWSTPDRIFLESSLPDEMQLVTSHLGAPVEGMKLSMQSVEGVSLKDPDGSGSSRNPRDEQHKPGKTE